MFSAPCLLLDGEGAAVERRRRRVHPTYVMAARDEPEHGHHRRMLRAPPGLGDGQRTFVERRSVDAGARLLADLSQVHEAAGDLRVLRTERLLDDVQAPAHES